jgi:hypothetical protein
MSNLPPPPPINSGPPPPPPPGPGGVPYSIPVSYGVTRPAATGLRTAAIVLMWVSVAANVFLTVAAFSRKGAWDDAVPGGVTLDELPGLDDADNRLGGALVLTFAVTLATAIVLAVWSYRTTSNGQTRGARVSPGLAAGGWFIPIGWYFVSFSQLRKAMGGRGDATAVGWWQGLWVVATVASGVALQLFDDDLDQTPSEVSDGLRNQSVGLVVATVLLAAATIFAMRALRAVDDATSGP